jgi:thioredoxin reductase
MAAGAAGAAVGVGPAVDSDAAWDLIVVGGGHAGTAAASAAAEAGLRVRVIERGAGATVVGLVPDGQDWHVEIQTADGAEQRRARSVLLATGGFTEPREHRAIAGPRPAGIVTADFVTLALAAGLRPGRRAVVVGRSDAADRVAHALSDAGCHVVDRFDLEPDEVRGSARLEALRVGTRWIEADTLVLADRLLPQPFLLRGLGLIDTRPGTPAPADADGRLPLPGLWAAGCCVHPDIDHAACAADGGRVGGSIAAALVPSSGPNSLAIRSGCRPIRPRSGRSSRTHRRWRGSCRGPNRSSRTVPAVGVACWHRRSGS